MREYKVAPGFLEAIAADFPEKELKIDKEMFLYDKFTPLLKQGLKKTTVRYGGEKIRLPYSGRLSLVESKEDDKTYSRELGLIHIPRLVIKSIDELTDMDGVNDAFSGRDELLEVLQSIYGTLKADDMISIYHIRLL